MKITTDGIVIKENDVGDYDRAVTVLTRDHGIIRAFSVGARRIKSKKNSSTSLLAYSRFTFSEKKDTYRIEEAEPIRVFFGLRDDIVKSSVAMYICELSLSLAPVDAEAVEFLRIVLNTLHFLEGDSDPHLLKSIAELRMISAAGYQPDLVACCKCGEFEKEKMYFDIKNASVICGDCFSGSTDGAFETDSSVLAAMRHIVYSDFSHLFSFSLGSERSRYLSDVTENYIKYTLERGFKTLDFLHSIDFS